MARSEELVQELESSDFVVIGTPMHNLTVPSTLKAWIDHVVRARRTFNITTSGKVGTLHDRPVFVAIASGGRFSGERARQPDFLTPYLTAILGMIGLHDLTFFSVQGTGAGSDAVAEARSRTDQALHTYFSSSFPLSAQQREQVGASIQTWSVAGELGAMPMLADRRFIAPVHQLRLFTTSIAGCGRRRAG